MRLKVALALLSVAGLSACCSTPPAPAPIQVGPAATPMGKFAAFVTGYTYYDNTPPKSKAVSHPKIHKVAGGNGTHADPITMAVGHSKAGGYSVLDFPAGTRFYMPYLDRYFIVEDTCGDGLTPENGACHQKPDSGHYWVDIWVDGQGLGADKANNCARRITGIHTVYREPPDDFKVDTKPICS